ncbi:MAG TPA: TetR/AcrR family transcriptional regulator [Mycobacteriales bacterium]|nr:TetR/AcrR family transcriptional regulator [Mycobacteriales bacterium]
MASADRDLPTAVAAAVRESVAAVGVRRTTLTDVARLAGVSRMTLYRMVPDVETLLLTVLTHDFEALLADIESATSRRRTARARLVAVAVETARRLPREPLFARILDVDPELLLPYLTSRLGSTQRLALERIELAVEAGQADRSIRRGDPTLIAIGVLTTVVPWVVSARVIDRLGRDDALDELARGLDGWLRP